MYTNYFGLKEKPFSLTPDPQFLYMSELHREALAHLLYGVGSDGCFILLTGDMGTGKTSVARCLLTRLPENTDVALIDTPCLTVLELLESICNSFCIDLSGAGKNRDAYVERIETFLLDAHDRGRNIALLVDEAQNLSLDLLEQLRLLINQENNQEKLLKIILLGQTELTQILSQEGATEINQRITSRYHLRPLDRESSFSYIEHHLAIAGAREEIFSQSAMSRVFELSSGIPRLINVLCDRALLGTYKEKKYLVSPGIVDIAGASVLGSKSEENGAVSRQSLWKKLLVLIALIGITVACVFYFLQPQSSVVAPPKPHALKVPVEIVEEATVEIDSEIVVPEVRNEEEESPRPATIRIIPLEINE